jgi:hypothetical protein
LSLTDYELNEWAAVLTLEHAEHEAANATT